MKMFKIEFYARKQMWRKISQSGDFINTYIICGKYELIKISGIILGLDIKTLLITLTKKFINK